MKNLSLILNIILIIAVGYLYFDEFTEEDQEVANQDEKNMESNGFGSNSLAFVNSDSLLQRYNYYGEVAATLEAKRGKLQQEYLRRAEALQKQFDDYQKTYLNMTVPQARAVEEDLMKKRQELGQYQESIAQDLMKEEAEITQKLYENVATYLKTYGDERNLQIVFTYSAGSGLLYANDALDITNEVIDALNLEYTNVEEGSGEK